MKESLRPNEPSATTVLQLVFRQGLLLERETAVFVLANALDVWMTYLLLTHEEISFIESNPVARYFLISWGIRGMVYFKFGLVAFVALTCQLIARQRLQTARGLLQLATVLVSGVVLYSLFLLLRHS